ncbi:MAG: hypothetical protein K2O06_10175 [Acetatifactor sp.]|nr:hypothetical protein [Acetatifactor sp.]
MIPMEGERFLLPSVVGYVKGESFLEEAAAKERLIPYPEDTAASFKRFMGTEKEYHLGGKPYSPITDVLRGRRENFHRKGAGTGS